MPTKTDKRLEQLINLLAKYNAGDFSEKAAISDKRDEIDAFAVGLNSLYTELTESLRKQEEQTCEIKKLNNLLEQQIEEKTQNLKKKETIFQAMIEKSEDVIMIVSPEGKRIFVSPSITNVLGFTPEEFLNSATQFNHPDELAALAEWRIQILNSPGKSFNTLWRLLHKDGSYRWCEGTSFNMCNDPNINAIIIKFRDINEKKNADEKIKVSEEQYRLFFENSGEAILLSSTDGRIFSANPEACKIFGMTEEEICRLGRNGLVNLNDPRLSSALEERKKKGKLRTELTFVKKDKTIFTGEISSTVFKSSNGDERTCIIIRDITERKKAEEKITKSNRLYAFQSAVNQSIIHINNEEDLFNKIGSIATEIGQFKLVWIGLLDESNKLHIAPLGGNKIIIKDIQKHTGMDFNSPQLLATPTGKALSAGSYAVSNDVQNDPAMELWKEEFVRHGIKANISLPIKKFGKIIGVLGLNSSITNFFDNEEISLLEEVVNEISFALENYEKATLHDEAEEKLQQSEKLFRNLFKNMHHGFAYCKAMINEGEVVDYTFIMVNSEFERILGIKNTEGKTITETLPGALESDPYYLQVLNDVVLHGKTQKFDTYLKPYAKWLSVTFYNSEGDNFIILIEDISERKIAEEKIKESETKLKDAQAIAKVGSWETDLVNNILFWSDEQYILLGFKPGEVVPSNELLLSMVHPDDSEFVNRNFIKTFETFESSFDNFKIIAKDGSVKHVFCEWKFEFDDKQMPLRIYGIVQDITERKKAEELISKNKKVISTIYDTTADTIFVLEVEKDERYRFSSVNKAFQETTGIPFEMVVGKYVNDIIPKPSLELVLEKYREAINEKKTVRWEETSDYPNGTLTGIISVSPHYDGNGNCVQLIGSVHDITQRKKDEDKIKQSEIQIRNFAKHLNQLQEDERGHIAREIHDELGQELVGIKIGLASFTKNILTPEEILNTTKDMMNAIDSAIQSLRKIATELRPGILDTLGLIPSIEWLGKEFERKTQIKCKIELNIKELNIDKDIAICFFRICQEALTNISKHANPSEVKIKIIKEKNELIMEVIDNGKGMSNEKLKNPFSMGLLGMRERATNIGGKLVITSETNKGTTIQLKTLIK